VGKNPQIFQSDKFEASGHYIGDTRVPIKAGKSERLVQYCVQNFLIVCDGMLLQEIPKFKTWYVYLFCSVLLMISRYYIPISSLTNRPSFVHECMLICSFFLKNSNWW